MNLTVSKLSILRFGVAFVLTLAANVNAAERPAAKVEIAGAWRFERNNGQFPASVLYGSAPDQPRVFLESNRIWFLGAGSSPIRMEFPNAAPALTAEGDAIAG